MNSSLLSDHPDRYALAHEIHARPFPALEAPARVAYLAMERAERDSGQGDRTTLLRLLDHFGAAHPQPEATHYSGQLGRYMLKWELHTEFVTYTLWHGGTDRHPFDPAEFDAFPEGWLAGLSGRRMTSALIDIRDMATPGALAEYLEAHFIAESVACSAVLEDKLTIAGDFRIDSAGHLRFAIFAGDAVGERRIGRVMQRLCEIETYKSMAMLGLAGSRSLGPDLNRIEARLNAITGSLEEAETASEAALGALLALSTELEALGARFSYRLAATRAYAAIVTQRIEILRERPLGGRQTFAEFMLRRFDPAMRTVKATDQRLQALSERVWRVAALLRTRVDIERSAQSQALLESMDRRADLQLRLQHTVEGLSVVAISYYAVNLALYVLGPGAAALGIGKGVLAAVLAPVVLILAWVLIRRLRARFGGGH